MGKPSYVIFKDVTLLQIAWERPSNEEDLRQITGVGEKKLLNYGEAVLEIVSTFG